MGRSGAMSMLESRNWLPESESDGEMSRNQDHLKAPMEAKEAAIHADARNIILAGIQRPLRSGMASIPKENDTASVYRKRFKEP